MPAASMGHVTTPLEAGRAERTVWPRTLAIIGTIPGDDGVAAILDRQILEMIPRAQLRVVSVVTRDVIAEHPGGHPLVDRFLARRYEYAYHPLPGLPGEVLTHLAHLATFRRHVRGLVDECVAQGLAHRCEAVFAVLENPTVIFLAERVARRLGVPLRCFVMDGPLLHVKDFSHDRFTARGLQRAFDRAMARADRIGTAGESMRDTYGNRYGKPAFILRQGLPTADMVPVIGRVPDTDVVTIGFAGSLTAADAFEQLLIELRRRGWRVGGRRVVLRLVGAHVKLIARGPQHIEYFGWQPVPRMLELMSECDFLYLPQPFGEDLREFSELSFPNKLCTYVPARRPLLLHAPPYASLHSFFGEFPCGPASDSLEATDLVDQVEAAMADPVRLQGYANAIVRAHRERLNDAALADAVRGLLSVSGPAHATDAA